MDPTELFKDIHSWEDFSDHLKDLPKKEKGDAFELLTQLYFKVNAIQKDLYDKVWLESELPAKVRKELNLPKGDMGIDLIAKSGKEYHAIQCKYHSEKSQNVTYKEVSTFLALYESNPKLTQGYICSSANGSSRRFKEISTKPVIWILSDSWQKLDKSFFDQARALLDDKAVEIKAYKPRKHQSTAVKNAVKHFKEESRGKLIFPCGAGKSLTGFWMIEKLKSLLIRLDKNLISLVAIIKIITNEVIQENIAVINCCSRC